MRISHEWRMTLAIQHSLPSSVSVPGAGPGKGLQDDFVALLDILKRGWKLVILSLLVCLPRAAIYLAKTKRAYQASTRLLVIQHGARPLNVTNSEDPTRVE